MVANEFIFTRAMQTQERIEAMSASYFETTNLHVGKIQMGIFIGWICTNFLKEITCFVIRKF